MLAIWHCAGTGGGEYLHEVGLSKLNVPPGPRSGIFSPRSLALRTCADEAQSRAVLCLAAVCQQGHLPPGVRASGEHFSGARAPTAEAGGQEREGRGRQVSSGVQGRTVVRPVKGLLGADEKLVNAGQAESDWTEE